MLSIIIPIFNEELSLEPLFEKIMIVLEKNGISSFEIILVDDGSNDNSWEIIENLVNRRCCKVKAIKLRKNFGKSYALMAGFKEASGEIVLTMDADLQDDPEEIPNFIKKIEEGYDLVSGWKKKRNDPISKTLPSIIFNKTTTYLTGLKLHDLNCGFKAYKKELLDNLEIYGELHRYIPVLAYDLGYKVAEIPVRHHFRKFGKTKYGFERFVRGFLDLLTVLTITRYLQKPGHFFGGLGIISGMVGFATLGYLSLLWFMGVRPIGTRPLFFFGILAVILCFQLISIGLLGELFVRNNNSRPSKKIIEKNLISLVDKNQNKK